MYNKRKTLIIAAKRNFDLLKNYFEDGKKSGSNGPKEPNFNKLSDDELEDLLIRYQCAINEVSYFSNSTGSNDNDNDNVNPDPDGK